jgi:hypothetical protein
MALAQPVVGSALAASLVGSLEAFVQDYFHS